MANVGNPIRSGGGSHPASGGAVEAMERIVFEYRERTRTSRELYERGRLVLAGGTTGNLRHFEPYPIYFRTGQGSSMIDVDGNRYVDCFLCNGPLLLGHRHPDVEAEIARRSAAGSLVVNPPLAIDTALEMQSAVPCAERVRFLNSGTEAVLSAVRLARAHTGRSRVIKFLGHYHGQDDQFLTGLDVNGVPLGAGIPASALQATVLLPYGNVAALETALAARDVAAVILDPAMHSGGLWGSSREVLQAARELTRSSDTLLIFDEVITGFRLRLGGAQEYYGVTPDLATYAKALGAGEKLAALAGRADVFAALDPARPAGVRPVFQSGTGNDGTAGLAAGLAALRTYRRLANEGAYDALAVRSRGLADGLRSAFAQHGVAGHVNQLGPMLQLFFADEVPTFETLHRASSEPLALFYLALINEGVLLSLPTSNHIYLSFAHTDPDFDQILAAVHRVLGRYDFQSLIGSRVRIPSA